MRYLSLPEILRLHEAVIDSSGGARGIRDINALESSINQPRLTFNQTDLYPDLVTKAAALCFFIVMNHPFLDGNKRTGHAAMETFLILNGFELNAPVDEQEKMIFDLAEGKLNRLLFTEWVHKHIVTIER
jgi:death-on-curing protein